MKKTNSIIAYVAVYLPPLKLSVEMVLNSFDFAKSRSEIENFLNPKSNAIQIYVSR